MTIENTSPTSLRRQTYLLLEEDKTWLARLLNSAIMLLIVANVIAIVIESMDSVYQTYAWWFNHFEVISLMIFSIEYLLRLWVCVENPDYQSPIRGRLRYMISFMALVDLIAILPFYLSIFTNIDARFLRIFRLLRIFKLTRHFQPLEILMQVIHQERAILASAVFVMWVLVIVAAGGIYVLEHDVQPEAFGSIPAAMWWAVVTLTTVGYGDIVPITIAGKMFAVLITMLGVGMAAMPAGIIAAGFTQEMQKRRDIFKTELRIALDDGIITAEEQAQLEKVRLHLGLNLEDTQSMTRAEFSIISELAGSHCPHCDHKLFTQLK